MIPASHRRACAARPNGRPGSGGRRRPCNVRTRAPVRVASGAVALIACWGASFGAASASAAVAKAPSAAVAIERSTTPEKGTATSLEAAAAKAGNTGRAVAMSLIGLAFAVAATVLAFRRDFKEAIGVFAVGIVSVLLATPAGVSLLRDTVSSIFGA